MSDRIYRYEVPVDDQWHLIGLTHSPLHVACRQRDVVEFWARHTDELQTVERRFRVVGTGQPFPDGWARHWGTALAPTEFLLGSAFAPNPSLVWHLIEGKQS